MVVMLGRWVGRQKFPYLSSLNKVVMLTALRNILESCFLISGSFVHTSHTEFSSL